MASVRKRGDTYQIRVSVGYDVRGNQVTRTKTWKPEPGMTKREIKNELNRQVVMFEQEVCNGMVGSSNIKFEEFAEDWLRNQAKVTLKKSTFELMLRMRKRVYKAFGHIRVDKITRSMVQRFIDDLRANGKNMRTGAKLSDKTVIHHLTFISDVMDYAISLGMIPTNPCLGIRKPRVRTKEKKIYSMEEAARLLELLESAPIKYRAFVTLGMYSGLRRAELLGLEWRDIDMEHEVINVRRTSNHSVGDGNYTDTTKSERSVRSLKLPSNVFEVLRELKAFNDD